MHHLTCGISSLLHSVNLILFTACPPGSPHPAHITSSQSPPSLSSPFTPDLKLISFTNPFLRIHSYSFRTDFADLNLYWIKGALLCLFWFLATCARLSCRPILSFRVHVKQWRSQKFFTGVRNSNNVSNFQPTPFTVSVESGTLTGERVITCRTSSMETWQKLRRCEHSTAAAHCWRHVHYFNLLDEELSKFVGVDVSWGRRRPLSRDKTDENNRHS